MSKITGDTVKTGICLVCPERMLYPRLTNLLKTGVVVGSTAHSIQVMGNDRMSYIWQREKIHGYVSGIATSRAHSQADLGPAKTRLLEDARQSDSPRDNIGPGIKTLEHWTNFALGGNRVSRAVAQKK